MSDSTITLGRNSIRSTDSNSLLRLYDRAAEILRNSSSQLERTRADKAMRAIATELAKRNIPL
jgi:hypothetical protein